MAKNKAASPEDNLAEPNGLEGKDLTLPTKQITTPMGGNRGVLQAATILAIGNVASRVLGLVREMVKANLFGTSGLLSAFETAVLVPNSLFELMIGGMINSALVPVFSDYAGTKQRQELWGVVSTFLSLATLLMLIVIGLVELFTPQMAALIGAVNFTDVALTQTSIQLMRLATPAMFFLGLSSVLTGVLFALERFSLPAFTGAIFNGTIVVVALLRPTDVSSLVWGMLIGSLLQVVLQLPALRDAHFRWQLNWRHPVIRRILWLYAPIIAGIAINQLVIALSYNLATRTGDQSLTYMRYATTLYQFPLGLVVTALSIATLPTLSQKANGHPHLFKQTLAEGIRLVVALIMPATIGLFALATPLIALFFEHGQFLPADTSQTALVLRFYLLGLPFAAVDQMLVFASYARKDTWRPALVGVISILIYSLVAIVLLKPLGLLSLMIADAIKHIIHTLCMFWFLRRQIGGLRGYGVLVVSLKAVLAASLMGGLAWGMAWLWQQWLPTDGLLSQLALIGLAGGTGAAVYGALAHLLQISEIRALLRLLPKSK